jgi:hypothetical protein
MYETLRRISDATGGRAVVADNLPARLIPEVLRENELYYTIGYRADGLLDDRFHRLKVIVDRPGVIVEPDGEQTVRIMAPSSALMAGTTTLALASLVPRTDQPLRLAVSSALAPEGDLAATPTTTIAVGMNLGLDRQGPEQVELQLRVFDGEGRKQLAAHQLTARVPASSNAHYDFVTTLALKPGRYNLRIGAHRLAGDVTGSVYTDFVIPDFVKAPMSMSDPFLIVRNGPKPVVLGSATAMPVSLSTERTFERSAAVTASTRVYWGRQAKAPSGVEVKATITDSDNRRVFERTASLAPQPVSSYWAADYTLDLPLANLKAGEHVLILTLTGSSGVALTRHIRFVIK